MTPLSSVPCLRTDLSVLEWAAVPFPGDLPDPGLEPRSSAWQADSSPAEPPGSPLLITALALDHHPHLIDVEAEAQRVRFTGHTSCDGWSWGHIPAPGRSWGGEGV